MNYHLVTLGCQMNNSDSERIATVIEQMGYRWTDRENEADLLGVVACSVRQKAIDKVYTRISKWNRWKNRKSLVTFVTGCVLSADREKFLRLFDLIFQISELPDFPAMLKQYGMVTPYAASGEKAFKDTPVNVQESDFQTLIFDRHTTIAGRPVMMKKPETRISAFWNVEPHYQSPFEAFVPIQNGCDKFCTFCAVPYTRGREISRPSPEILAEVQSLVEKGYKSIMLLGQNVNSYGMDKKGEELSFADLLAQIGEYGNRSRNDYWLYFTSPHPCDMNDDVLQTMSRYPCLAKQIHLPLQSGDNEILTRMNRNHSMEDYRKIIASIRKHLPSATLFTDIIVGFAGETEEQFINTKAAMEEFSFNMAYVACYSPRPGSAASRWDDDVPHQIKKDRLHRLSSLLQTHSLAHNHAMIGKTFKTLVTGTDRKTGLLSGMTEGRIIVRITSEDTRLIGEFVDVKINTAANFSTEGELIKVYNTSWAEA